jgi:DNA-binding response OmpR family regulator
MLRDSQHLLSADELLERLWSSDDFPSEATVRSHIRRLRHKLVAAGAPSDFIATVHGRGYYLKAPDFVKPLPSKTSPSPSHLMNPSSANSQFHQQQSSVQNIDLVENTIENNASEAITSISSSFAINQLQLGIRVMVVDDDTEYLRSLPDLLAPWEFKVTTLDNSQEFWTVLEAVLPDILVLEVNISRINGLEICQKLRNNLKWQGLPVLFLSTITDVNTQHLAFSVGADDYLCKPIEAIAIASRIHNRLQRIRAYQSYQHG